jgi:hypothetical protein
MKEEMSAYVKRRKYFLKSMTINPAPNVSAWREIGKEKKLKIGIFGHS